MKILYYSENIHLYFLTFKSIGHQWYWTYEIFYKFLNLKFDSYILTVDDLDDGDFRLLEVDNRIVIPIICPIRNIVTSSDVIHSWALPAAGVKVDAIPGRLNQISLFILRTGVYYGQCSEICGINHRFMPIVIEVGSLRDFCDWLSFYIIFEEDDDYYYNSLDGRS